MAYIAAALEEELEPNDPATRQAAEGCFVVAKVSLRSQSLPLKIVMGTYKVI
jgi:hypothetical protein